MAGNHLVGWLVDFGLPAHQRIGVHLSQRRGIDVEGYQIRACGLKVGNLMDLGILAAADVALAAIDRFDCFDLT